MIRRRIVIEWDDDGTDTDEDCLKEFLNDGFTVHDLFETGVRVRVALSDNKNMGWIELRDGDSVAQHWIQRENSTETESEHWRKS